MKKVAVEKARKRLALARSELDAVRLSRNFEAFETAWYRFLVAANSVDAVLEFGARSDSKSRPWYGGKKKQRKDDPLLSYMHQARNVDEHGIEAVAEHVDGGVKIGLNGEAVHIGHMTFDRRGMRGVIHPVDGTLPTIKVTPPHVRLITVIDERYDDRFDPPTEHLGKPLADASPVGIATLWLNYLETLIEECAQRAA